MALFEAKHLHKRFGDAVVLEDISLSFDEGRLSGIMGPNGAGKTTCFNVLTGRYKPDRGEVRFEDRVITGATPRAVARLGISRSFQVMNLFNDYTALDNVLVALPAVRRRGFDAWSDLGADSSAQDEAAAVLARVGLAGRERIPAKSLPYGERRALEIGVALAAHAAPPVPGRADRRTRHRGHGAAVRADRRTEAHADDRRDRARHELPVRPRRPHLGDPLGPGHRRRDARRTARGSVGATLESRTLEQ